MLPRNKKEKKVEYLKTDQYQFLLEHNKLSPPNLQATMPLLSRFRTEKASIFKADDWPIDKIRRPFILWLMSLAIDGKNKDN